MWHDRIYDWFTSRDELTWLSHALICWPPVVILTILHHITAVIASEAALCYFCMREGSNWHTHKIKGHSRAKYLADGIGDLVGPVTAHAWAWWVFLH